VLAGAAIWAPWGRVVGAAAAVGCAPPPNFPAGIELYREAYRNWSSEIAVDDVWTCAPASATEVATIATWAAGAGYRARAVGMRHGWSPLTLASGGRCPPGVLLVDTTRHLTRMRMGPGVGAAPATVVVEAGATMDQLLGYLEDHGYGMTSVPAPGDVTVGGVLAIDGHGASIPARGERREPGTSYGSLSNLVLSLTAVVWDDQVGRFVVRTFDRADRPIAALLAHLGRAFVTEVTLQVGRNANLRCQSFVDIPATELFAAPGVPARTFSSFLDSAGRAEAIWFPFTENPWLKVWSVAPNRPLTSRPVDQPYNYPFSDNVPDVIAALAADLVPANGQTTPLFGQLMYDVAAAGLAATASSDIWGPSKNTLLYIRPSTLRVTANGYAVLTRRSEVQAVLHEFAVQHLARVEEFRARGLYPANMPLEIRVTGLDQRADVDGQAGSTPRAPGLSAVLPRSDHSEWNVAVWFDVLSLPSTPGAAQFFRETEQWMYATYRGDRAAVRVEWSKGWAYTDGGAWTDTALMQSTIPESFRTGRRDDDWDAMARTLDELDPLRVFTSPLLDRLFPVTEVSSS
jgi:FAD/FMN-containing dehydrogenase